MPTATLTFALPDEDEAFRDATQAQKYKGVLVDLAREFRSKAKFSEEPGSWEEAKDLFWATLGEAGVEID